MTTAVVMICVSAYLVAWAALWLLARHRRGLFEMEMSRRWSDLRAAANQQRETHAALLESHHQERATWQAEHAGLRAQLHAQTLETERRIATEAFERERCTPDDELPQVHEQVFAKQTLRMLTHR